MKTLTISVATLIVLTMHLTCSQAQEQQVNDSNASHRSLQAGEADVVVESKTEPTMERVRSRSPRTTRVRQRSDREVVRVAQKPSLPTFDLEADAKKMEVRVTVYWKTGAGSDYYTSRGMSATGRRLVNKKSAAVDPKVIPYGSKIVLPEIGKELEAVDTGSAVKKRTAARKLGRDVPVIDIFFDCRTEAMRFAKSHPLFMTALILQK